jgi:predicted dehydrogenase
MSDVVRWGVLGVATIAVDDMIPALQSAENCEVVAIASRDHARAGAAADRFGIARAYGAYAELLADPEVDAVYNPLPNHLHVEWSIRAAEAGKHVLCEKPVGLDADQARALLAARDRTGVLIGEAFMARSSPQWTRVRDLLRAGSIGRLGLVMGSFTYFDDDAASSANRLDCGGGSVMDIGCYPITLARMLFEAEPRRVVAAMDRDPALGIDRLASAILEFPRGHATFSSATQLADHQRMQLIGTTGTIEVEMPWNPAADLPTRLRVDGALEEIAAADQYRHQAELFARAILDGGPAPTTLEDAVANMTVIDAVYASAERGTWIDLADARR